MGSSFRWNDGEVVPPQRLRMTWQPGSRPSPGWRWFLKIKMGSSFRWN